MTYKTRGIVIKRINLGEADRIITFYTSTLGKVRTKAQSVRKIEAKLSGHLELLTLVDLILAKGHSLDVVTSAQTINSFSLIRQDLCKISFAYFIIELIDKLVPEELKDTRIFNLLVNVFEILNSKDLEASQSPILLIYFEIKLLDLLGFAPQISRCVHCAKTDSLKFYFSAMLGGILCEECKIFDRLAYSITKQEIETLKSLRSLPFNKNFNLKIDPSLAQLLSLKIDYFIRFIFDKNIKSAEFIKKVGMLK